MPDKREAEFQNSTEWRDKFSEFLQEERKNSAGLSSSERFPNPGTLRQAESKASPKVADIDYLLRVLIWFLAEAEYQPSNIRLRRLVILWFLAKLERTPELSSFQKALSGDYESLFRTGETVTGIFRKKWEEYGVRVQRQFEQVLRPVYQSLLDAEAEAAAEEATPDGGLPTLDRFPEAFEPLAVIVGGYTGEIQKEPEHVYELFRQSQSLVNFHYLPRLRLRPETQIISDQLFIEMDEAERAEVLGNHHLLVIGEPRVNAVSRYLMLTKRLVFSFAFRSATYRWGEQVYDKLVTSGLFKNSVPVKILYRMLNVPQSEVILTRPEFTHAELSPADVEKIRDLVLEIRRDFMGNLQANNQDITDRFAPQKVFSPLETELRSVVSTSRHERAVISLGENPWAKRLAGPGAEHPKYSLISVSGINELSTALAVKALGHKGNFRGRPLGGVLDISEESRYGPLKRVTESAYDWVTRPYTVEDVLQRVDSALEPFGDRPSAFSLFGEKSQLATYQEMVSQFARRAT